jgi:hypothetical protein
VLDAEVEIHLDYAAEFAEVGTHLVAGNRLEAVAVVAAVVFELEQN